MPSSHSLTLWIVVLKAFLSAQHQDRCTMNIFSPLLENIFTYLLLNLSKVIREWRFWGTWDSFDSPSFHRQNEPFFLFNPIQTWQPFCHLLLHSADSPENTHTMLAGIGMRNFVTSYHRHTWRKKFVPLPQWIYIKMQRKVPFRTNFHHATHVDLSK